MNGGWFKSKTAGASVAHFFRDGESVSACGSLRRLEGEIRSDGFAARQSTQRGFLAEVDPAPAAGIPHCRRCQMAMLPGHFGRDGCELHEEGS